MPEPVTLVLTGIALYTWLRSRGVSAPTAAALAQSPAAATANNTPISTAGSGTGPTAPFATNTSVVNQASAPLATALDAQPIPSGLVVALDDQTALALRGYAQLNPDDFQRFLNQYADRLVLRNDLMLQAIQDPPSGGYQLTPNMMIGLGPAAYKVIQGLNGVAAGNYGDVFGIASTVAGKIPDVNPDLVHALQGATMAYRAITSISDVMTIAANAHVSLTDLTALTNLGGAAGAYPGLAALPISGVLMAVGLAVDIGFTIAGDAPDIQKAIDVALDVASLAVLFIPFIGLVVAIVIQLVKFIIDLFGSDLFGGGLSHEQREILETARYGANINPMFPELSNAYTPRELWHTIVAWGSGYCGGNHVVAMAVSLVLHAGDQLVIGGQPYTVPPELDGILLGFGENDRSRCYWLASTPFANMTNDEQAWALAMYAPTNGIIAMAQAGIVDWRKVQFNDPTQKLIMARAAPMQNFLQHHITLDQIDQIALEYRAQPHLNALAAAFGYPDWQHMMDPILAVEWARFNFNNGHGTLTDFARQNGYPTMFAFRAAALATYEDAWSQVTQANAWAVAEAATLQSIADAAAAQAAFQAASSSAP
jgi:hypothetical protein